jgi:glycosyltransferase involved in cell wall biosynthesis
MQPVAAAPLPLTIIIPVHNRPEALNRALASIGRQSSPPAKVIVVDDASSLEPVIEKAM